MSEHGMECDSGVGRVVWGSPSVPRPKTHQDGALKGKPVIDETTGQPIMEIAFGLAIPKQQFQDSIWPTMAAEIATGYPNGAPARFSYKYVDGDDNRPLADGKQPYAQREGYAGCFVLAYTQRINAQFAPPPIYQYNPANGQYVQLPGEAVKCGDYIAVKTNFKVNVATGTHTPSVYVNPRGIEFVGYGTAIVSAAAFDPNASFGGVQRALPPGASATPMQQPNAPGMPGTAPAPAPMAAPAAMPGMTPAPAPMAAPPAPVAAPVGPQRPVDPSHVHDNGNGTEQWFVNGAWDGQAHPITPAAPAAPAPLPPPAPAFTGMPAPAAPMAMPAAPAPAPMAAPGAMPGVMPPR